MSWRDYIAMGLMVVLVFGVMIAVRRLVAKDDEDMR